MTDKEKIAKLEEALRIVAKAELYDLTTGIIDADVLFAVQEAARRAVQINNLFADAESCIACAEPLVDGDKVYPDTSGGFIHAACCGPGRESYVADGEPLKVGAPVPEPIIWRHLQ